jgi:hypothetical protein
MLGVALLIGTVALAQPGEMTLLLAHPVRVSGIVADAIGNPIPGAMVAHSNLQGKPVETGADGRFTLETDAPAVVIQKPEYRSQRVETLGSQEIRVTLKHLSQAFPVCGETSSWVGMDGLIFGGFFFRKIPGVKATRPKMDVDYLARTYSVAVLGKRYAVWHGTGPLWGGSEPSDELVWMSAQFEEVEYDVGGNYVVDARGVLPNGNRWHHLGSSDVSASYRDVPPEAAATLDKLLDSACWKPSPQS